MRIWALSLVALVAIGETVVLDAQRGHVEIGVGVVAATVKVLDSQDVGLSARLSWLPTSSVGVEGEVGFYPSDLPQNRPVTARRTEMLFGVTAGPRVGRVRPFVRLRPGVLRLAAAPQPVACILIFPPPLACTLAGGASLFVVDLGGGLEFYLSPRTTFRVDVGDRLTRYPGPAITQDGTVNDDTFNGHDLRVAVSAGWRF